MPDDVQSALAVVEDDAARIPDNLVPPGSSVEKVLGALIARIADGKPLDPLTDESLGIVPPPEENPPASVPPASEPPAGVPPASVPPADVPPASVPPAPVTSGGEPLPGVVPTPEDDDEAAEATELAELKKENERLKEEAASKGAPA